MAKGSVPTGSENKLKHWWDGVKQYFNGVYSEMKKVHWPGRIQLVGYTGVVLLSVAFIGLIIWLFDSGLSFLLERLMKVAS